MHYTHIIIPPRIVSHLLDDAIGFTQHKAATTGGDVRVGSAGFRQLGAQALTLKAWDAERGEYLTWGVLATALVEVREWMREPGRAFGGGYFDILVGETIVGRGSIG